MTGARKSLSHRLVKFSEKYQVELQGKYSVERLESLHGYMQTANLSRFALSVPVTALPCLATVVLADLFPLNFPYDELSKQEVFWIRAFCVVIFIVWSVIEQLHVVVPWLPLSTRRKLIISTLASGITALYGYLLALWLGFPIPFMLHLTANPMISVAAGGLAHAWYRPLQTDVEAQERLKRCGVIFSCTTFMIVVYPLYNHAFSSKMRGTDQALFSLVLPLIKLITKNWISRALRGFDDLAPEVVVFNAEVFHALFVSMSMQGSSSFTTTLPLDSDRRSPWVARIARCHSIDRQAQSIERQFNERHQRRSRWCHAQKLALHRTCHLYCPAKRSGEDSPLHCSTRAEVSVACHTF